VKYKGRSARETDRVPGRDDRPREKLERVGAAGLGDNELLAIVLGVGTREASGLALANQVLAAADGLRGLLRATHDELVRVRGLGPARAAQVLAAIELGRRSLTRQPSDRVRFCGPREAAGYLLPSFGSQPVEQFGLVLLDTRHRVIRTVVLSVGTLDSTAVQPRDVFKQALGASAAAIVLFHNHPSGDPEPSRDDIALTLRLAAAGELMGVAVVDHIVLGDGRYASLKESGCF
jgi:DNA repair protein RadC